MKKSIIETDDFIEQHDLLVYTYKSLEKNINIKMKSNGVSYSSPVNFTESMSTPRHRWFPYKEGFSPTFVKDFLQENMNGKGGVVLDPFCGVGTTPIVAAQLGYKAIGMDVSPLAIFVSKTKSLELNKKENKHFNFLILKLKNSTLSESYAAPENATVIKYFETDYLEALLKIRAFIETIEEEKIKSLFFLAYLSIIEEFSTHRKAGNGVKRKTKFKYRDDPGSALKKIRNRIIVILKGYSDDLDKQKNGLKPEFKNKSCLEKKTFENINDISCVITSPPYANCFDYSKIYMRELWLGDFFKTKSDHVKFRSESLRSHVHATWEDRYVEFKNDIIETNVSEILKNQQLWSKKIPGMLSGYFKDITRLLDLLSLELAPGSRVGFVVSNSFYGGIPIATDLLISQCADKIGFKTVRIDIYRGMIPSSQQYKRIEDKYFMRESLVILEKKNK